MIKKILPILLLVGLIILPVLADEPEEETEEESLEYVYFPSEMINLKMPNQQEPHSLIFIITHRFYGELNHNPMETANLLFGIKYIASPKVELEALYGMNQNEYSIGAGYYFLNSGIIHGQFNATLFDYKDIAFEERSINAFYQLSMDTKPLFKHVTPVVNAGYDGYYERFGYGFGLKIAFNIANSTVKKVNIISEYYPITDPEAGITQPKPVSCFGIGIDTFRHNFVLQVTNGNEAGVRRLMLGAPDDELHFGFNILVKF
ncbi:MAG: hypothetical protein HY811_00700 [Planctomycetes bacterium]|nr:hypothetical protein [Planctomycetota bacterium]